MPLTVVDFSEVCFVVLRKSVVPLVRGGKFAVADARGARLEAKASLYRASERPW